MSDEKVKVVRSKDVLDAIDAAVSPVNRLQVRGGEVGLLIYQHLAAIPEFYADTLVNVKDQSLASTTKAEGR